MPTFTVTFVYLDEPTPRDVHTEHVEAVDAEEAKLHVWTRHQLAGDKVSATSATPVEG